jgi:DNA-binding response OmpR family regulator
LPDELKQGSGLRKVLIVDDESTIRETLGEHLSTRSEPYEVVTASDGFEAGRLVATVRPDVVLLDLRMPGIDGFQICRTIKADPESSNTVVIAMTGYYSQETAERILECGAVRCFAKPVEPSTLSAFIDTVFEQQGRSKRRGRSARV